MKCCEKYSERERERDLLGVGKVMVAEEETVRGLILMHVLIILL